MFEIEEVFSPAVRIKVIGVGGAGGNAVDHMIDAGIQGVEFIVINTDQQALNQKKASVKIAIGAELTQGKGAGADPEIGRRAAMESQEAIAEALRGADMVFVAAGMGKGTGTGAAPVVAEISRSLGILTLPVVTRPFTDEGVLRIQTAEAGLAALAQVSDSVLVIPNDCLLKLAPKSGVNMAFRLADSTLCHAVQSIAEVIQSTGRVNCDFNDVKAIMGLQGGVYLGVGSASGEGSAMRAASQALANPYLDGVNIQGSKGMLAHITYRSEEEELTTDDLHAILKALKAMADNRVNLIYGLTHNPEQAEEVRVTVVAAGFKKKAGLEAPSPMLGDFGDLAKAGSAKRQKIQPWGTPCFPPRTWTCPRLFADAWPKPRNQWRRPEKGGLMRFWLILALMSLPLAGQALSGIKLKNLANGQTQAFACLEDPSQAAGEKSLPLKEAVLFLGGTVTWQSDPKNLVIQYHGDQYSLCLSAPYVWINGKRREFLPQGFRLVQGEPCLNLDSMKRLVAVMGLSKISFQDASVDEIPPSPTPYSSPTPYVIPASEPKVATPPEPVLVKTPKNKTLAKALSEKSGINVVVLDPGHGGYDSGAIGRHKRYEKDFCLDIALILRNQLKKAFPDLRVILTRSRDTFVSLKDRCEIANRAEADLFVSIHNNSAPSSRSHGTQVFFYDSQSSNRDAEFLARQENANANYLEITLMDLEKAQVRDQSIQLAKDVEGELVKTLKLKGRRLQYAPFYVLAKTKMPAVLVEAAFISNPQEAKLLATRGFREQIAYAIAEGIKLNKQRAESE